MTADDRTETIFGGFDGLTSTISMIGAAVIAGTLRGLGVYAVGLAVGAAWSMGSGQYLSDPQRRVHLAVVMALATLAGSIAPAVPFLVGGGTAIDVAAACALTLAVGAAIAELRPGSRAASYRLTFAVLAVGVILGAAVGLLG